MNGSSASILNGSGGNSKAIVLIFLSAMIKEHEFSRWVNNIYYLNFTHLTL